MNKCFTYGTEILMFDGTKKEVQNLIIGDIIMGDDSTPRKVLSTFNGNEQMYDIVPIKGDTLTVSESHTLVVKCTVNGNIGISRHGSYIVKFFDGNHIASSHIRDRENAELFSRKVYDFMFDITVHDYFNVNKSSKSQLKLFGVPIEYPKQDVILDPYYLGLWLGDGTTSKTNITNIDSEIVEIC